MVLEPVDPSGPPWDNGSTRLLDGTDTAKGPEITVRDPRELLLNLLHVVSGNVLKISSRASMLAEAREEKRIQLTRPLLAPWVASGLNRMVA